MLCVDNIEALELFGTLSDKGRGCPKDGGVAQKCRDRAAFLREKERESNTVALDRLPPPPEAVVVVAERRSWCAAHCASCTVM